MTSPLTLTADNNQLLLGLAFTGGTGESNTASAINTGGGVGVVATTPKAGAVLQFRGVNTPSGGSGLVLVTLNGATEEIEVDIDTDQLMADLNPQNLLRIDDVGALTYVGEAQATGTATSAASWRIYRLDESGGTEELVKLYGGGSTAFDQIWDNRLALSYT